jgi:phosphoglycolate phosphatase
MQLDGMIFDLDGTLTDTFAVCFTAFRETIRAVTGHSATDDEIYAHFGPSEEGMFQRWVPERWEECLRLYLAAYEREHRRTGRTFPGIETALGLLRERGIPLAVVTGKGPHSAAISLTQLGLLPYFDCIETGSPEGSVKVRCIERVLSRWRVTPDRVAYLGDVVSDIEASRAVGAIPLAAAWEERSDAGALRALKPLAVFDAVPQFIQWIEATVEPRASGTPRSGTAAGVDPDPSRRGTGT